MIPNRECVGPSDTVAAANRVIEWKQTPALPVLDHAQPVGTVGTQEIAERVPEGKHPGFVRVAEVMTPYSTCAGPDEDAVQVEERMREEGLATIPVVENGRVIGVMRLSK